MDNKLKKIAIVGPESTGKTMLSKLLAKHYETQWVPEFAREYLEIHGGNYAQEDVEFIAREQIKSEDQYAAKTEKILFCDTNLVVIKIWMENAYNHCPDWILEEIKKRNYDLYLLTNIDLPWVPDPLREHPDLREYLYEKYLLELYSMKVPFVEISGNLENRLEKAVEVVDGFLANRSAAS